MTHEEDGHDPDTKSESPQDATFTFIEDTRLPAPENRPAFKKHQNPPPHPDTVRSYLAGGVMVILAIVTIVGVLVWWLQPERDMRDYLLLITPIVSLAGAIVGFYFGQQQSD
ncbi:MAG: hypothetical protein ACR2H3_07970 [Acidimicrobiales bacterium]